MSIIGVIVCDIISDITKPSKNLNGLQKFAKAFNILHRGEWTKSITITKSHHYRDVNLG